MSAASIAHQNPNQNQNQNRRQAWCIAQNACMFRLPFRKPVHDIACGDMHVAFVVAVAPHQRTLFALGDNHYGQLGVSGVAATQRPVVVPIPDVDIASVRAPSPLVARHNKQQRLKPVFLRSSGVCWSTAHCDR